MRIFLIGVLLASTAWSRQEADSRVPGLVVQLNDDSVEIREGASAELVALGEPALPALKQALLGAVNEEVRGRIKDVLDRISSDVRRRAFKGGTPVDGLAASLEARREKDSKEFVLKIQIMNVGHQARNLVLIQRWNTRLPETSRSSSGSEAAVEVEQLSGEFATSFSSSLG